MCSDPSGTLTVPAGTVVNLVNGGAETAGRYYLLGYGSNADPFSHLSLGTQPTGFSYALSDDTGNDSVDLVVAAPEPSLASLLAIAPLGLLARRRRWG